MKILYVADLHGSRWKYSKILGLAKKYQSSVVINGGDMLPKNEGLFEQDHFITGYLRDHFAAFNRAGIHYLCYLCNDDLRIFDELFEHTCSQFTFVHCIAQQKIEIESYEFIGMNWVVDYPFRLKDRCRMDTDDYVFQKQLGSGLLSTSEGWHELNDWFAYVHTLPTIEKELKKLPHPKNMARSIYVIHMPPSGLGLDMTYQGTSVGSKAVYNFLKMCQPLVSLHGHIHEAPEVTDRWHAKLGKTLCIQPGQLNDLTYVTVDLAAMKFDRIKEKYDI